MGMNYFHKPTPMHRPLPPQNRSVSPIDCKHCGAPAQSNKCSYCSCNLDYDIQVINVDVSNLSPDQAERVIKRAVMKDGKPIIETVPYDVWRQDMNSANRKFRSDDEGAW